MIDTSEFSAPTLESGVARVLGTLSCSTAMYSNTLSAYPLTRSEGGRVVQAVRWEMNVARPVPVDLDQDEARYIQFEVSEA